jgi:hypothetical protein
MDPTSIVIRMSQLADPCPFRETGDFFRDHPAGDAPIGTLFRPQSFVSS